MNVLQIGAAQSGNLWLWKVIQQVIDRAGLPNRSLVREHAIREVADAWELGHDRQADIDILDIEELGLFWRISSVFRMPVEDIGAYLEQSNHVWTYSQCCTRTRQVLSKFDRVVYIVRDPRDRLLSAARFAFTPYMQKFWPHDVDDPVTFVEHHFDEYIEDWRWHVQDYLALADSHDIHLVFFERLLHDFEAEVGRLIDYLGVDLDAEQREAIFEATCATRTGDDDLAHLQKENSGRWHARLDRRQKGRAVVLCGQLLDLFDYPRYREFSPEKLPSLTGRLPAGELERSSLPRS